MTMTTTTAGPIVKRRPIRGFVWGLIAGLGLALILINFAVIALGTMAPWAVTLAVAVLGVLWGLFGPARTIGVAPVTPPPSAPPGPPLTPEPPPPPPPAPTA
jgi:hypothetical protein